MNEKIEMVVDALRSAYGLDEEAAEDVISLVATLEELLVDRPLKVALATLSTSLAAVYSSHQLMDQEEAKNFQNNLIMTHRIVMLRRMAEKQVKQDLAS